MPKLSSIELFTGAGGMALATHHANFSHRGLFEWNKDACETLRSNASKGAVKGIKRWESLVTEGDVSDADFTRFHGVDLVAGGPPCQPFSIGGKHRGRKDRRDMIPEFVRAVRETQPKAFIMENVRGLTRPKFRNYFSYSVLQLTYPDLTRRRGERWESHLARLEQHHTSGGGVGAYRVLWQVLNAADFGVPQKRYRVVVVGFRDDITADWSFPQTTHSEDALLWDQWVSGGYWERVGVKPVKSLTKPQQNRVKKLLVGDRPLGLPWRTVREAVEGLPSPSQRGEEDFMFPNHNLQPGARVYPGHTGSVMDQPAKALKAGDHGVPGGENMMVLPRKRVRYFTVRESARLQCFPDSWRYSGAWGEAMRQLGNAVPVAMLERIATGVSGALRG